MRRTAARLLAATAVTLALVAGAQPASAVAPPAPDGTTGLLCKILKIKCP